MKNWEDIIKEKLENFESELPERSFADFRVRQESTNATPHSKRIPVIWLPIATIAAGLALFFILKQTSSSEGITTNVVQQPSDIVAVTTAEDPDKEVFSPSTIKSASVETIEKTPEETTTTVQISDLAEEEKTIDPPVIEPAVITKNILLEYSKDNSIIHSVNKKRVFVPIIALGGLTSVITPTLIAAHNEKSTHNEVSYAGNDILIAGPPSSPIDVDQLTKITHHFPLKIGLSTGIPLSNSLNISTGLEYSLYSSDLTYSISGTKKQYAHYIGIPVRLDWTFASTGWMNAYIGAGVSGDYCLKASLSGESIPKDGFCFSILGAGGVQINLSKKLGIYFEPEISWSLPSESRILKTYRTDHPITFSVATGLRINLVK